MFLSSSLVFKVNSATSCPFVLYLAPDAHNEMFGYDLKQLDSFARGILSVTTYHIFDVSSSTDMMDDAIDYMPLRCVGFVVCGWLPINLLSTFVGIVVDIARR